jgi:hypothetical protein
LTTSNLNGVPVPVPSLTIKPDPDEVNPLQNGGLSEEVQTTTNTNLEQNGVGLSIKREPDADSSDQNSGPSTSEPRYLESFVAEPETQIYFEPYRYRYW